MDSHRFGRRLRATLLIVSATAVALSSAWLVTSCAQSGTQQPGNQNQQTRPRRTLEINNPPPGNGNTKDKTGQMPNQNEERNSNNPFPSSPYYTALEAALSSRGTSLANLCSLDDPVSRRVLEEYGSIFVAAETVTPPPTCVFKDEAGVTQFHREVQFKAAVVGGTRIELQTAAMDALLAAREVARKEGLDITPRGGSEAARRDYADTYRLWNTRFLPALAHWRERGKLSKEKVAELKSLPIHQQVQEVLELEKRGIFFSTDFSKSILYSIAAPGTSQHISMLALDVSQFANARVRSILAQHGWFQTVKSDMPHFTYLGLKEEELPSRGLVSVKVGAQLFWIPNVGTKG